MRPVQQLGLTPDGVHRYLYTRSRDGELYMDRRMFALDFGTNVERFSACLDVLVANGLLVEQRVGTNVRLEWYRVVTPEGYDSNAPLLGQGSPRSK